MHACAHTCTYVPSKFSSYTSYFHYSVYMQYTITNSIGITVNVYSIVITSYCLLQMMCSVSTLDLHVCQPGQETNHDVSTQKVSTQEATPGGVSIPCPGMGWTHLLRWMPLLAWGVPMLWHGVDTSPEVDAPPGMGCLSQEVCPSRDA